MRQSLWQTFCSWEVSISRDLTLFFALALFTVRSQCRVQWWWSGWTVLLKMKQSYEQERVWHMEIKSTLFEVVILIAFKPWGSPLFFLAISYFVLYFNFDLDGFITPSVPFSFLIPAYVHFCAARLASFVIMTCPWPQNDLLYRLHNLLFCTSHMSMNEFGCLYHAIHFTFFRFLYELFEREKKEAHFVV